MTEVSAADKLTYVKSKIGEYADFPKKGIVFRWVSELIRFGICSRTRLYSYLQALMAEVLVLLIS